MTDYMKEAERLADEYGDAVSDVVGFAQDPAGYSRRVEATRAALLAHIQRGVPDGDDGKRVLREVFALCEDTETKCSDETGDFARGRRFEAKGIARAIGAWYQEEFCGRAHMGEPAAVAPDHSGDATETVAEPAEVPMPEPVAYLYTLEYGETVVGRRLSEHQLNYPFGVCGSDYLAQTDDGVSYVRQTPLYTKDAEAAGYARGRKEAGRDAELYRIALQLIEHATAPTPDDGAYHENAHELAKHALRGEVK